MRFKFAKAGDSFRQPSAVAHELSADEARLTALVRSSGPFSLADRTLPAELGWAYGKVHRVANELVRRGVLTRTEAPGEIGRPRVVYSLTVA